MNYKTTLLCIIAFLIASNSITGQAPEKKIIEPILLDKSALSGVGLKKVDLKDEPEKDFFQKILFRGTNLSVFVVSSQSWTSDFKDFWFDEFIYLLNGKARINSINDIEQTFYTGDYFFAPKGFTGEWEIASGGNYHYELSVITTKRADKSIISEIQEPILLDRNELSGINTVLRKDGTYESTLTKGVELTITYHAQSPREENIPATQKDQMLHLLSGQLTLSQTDHNTKTYYAGDFIILPKGYTGNWKSDGHGLIKYIAVESTNA